MQRRLKAIAGGMLAAAALLLPSPVPAAEKPEVKAMAATTQPTMVKGEMLPITFEIHRLSTGLSVSLVRFDSPGLAAFFTAMRVGSRDEVEPGHSGFAHLFEHMMFRGTKKMPGEIYDQKRQELGADSSAWTWYDQTVYYFVASSQALPEVIEMEAERFQNLEYQESEFKTESGAVLGEYYKNLSDPSNQMEEDLMNLAFENSTYKHTTMGFLADIQAMPGMYQYSLAFFRRHYAPPKAVIFIVGDFEPVAVMQKIRKEYASWTRPGEEAAVPAEPEQKAERRMHREWKNPVLPQVLVGYKAPAYDNSNVDYAALTLVGEMLFGKTSPLYRKLVLDTQLAESINFWDVPHRDPGLWSYSVKLKREEFDGVLKETDRALQEIIDGQTSARRLEEVKSHYRYAFALGFETPLRVANTLCFYATLDGDPASAEKFLRQINQVTIEDLKRVAAHYLLSSRRTVVTLSHPGKKGGA